MWRDPVLIISSPVPAVGPTLAACRLMDLCSGNPELPAILEGTEVNSEQVLCKACESLGGELLKSVWTGVELHLPLSSFHFCFPLTVTCWS